MKRAILTSIFLSLLVSYILSEEQTIEILNANVIFIAGVTASSGCFPPFDIEPSEFITDATRAVVKQTIIANNEKTYNEWSFGNHDSSGFILWAYPWISTRKKIMEIVAAADGTIFGVDTNLRIESNALAIFTQYTNLLSEKLFVDVTEIMDQIALCDLKARHILENNLNQKDTVLNFQNLKTSVYFDGIVAQGEVVSLK